MPHSLALAVELITTALAVAGMGYFLAALVAARIFIASRRKPLATFAPGVSILKSLKGLDPEMLAAFRSHCKQTYSGEFEMLFGFSSPDDPAVTAVKQLQREFPERLIRLIECPLRLGTNGKVSTLAQLVPQARYDFLLVNDSDITVGPRYLELVMAKFATDGLRDGKEASGKPSPVGLVTALYRGRSHRTLPSRLESLGIAVDFMRGARAANCKAIARGLDILCTGCDPDCSVNRISRRMRNMGVKVYLVPHSSGFSRWLDRWQRDKGIGVTAVACMLNILEGGYEMRARGIPSQCLPLDYPGCRKHWDRKGISTALNEERLAQLVTLK